MEATPAYSTRLGTLPQDQGGALRMDDRGSKRENRRCETEQNTQSFSPSRFPRPAAFMPALALEQDLWLSRNDSASRERKRPELSKQNFKYRKKHYQ
jgi:hypothetical protein